MAHRKVALVTGASRGAGAGIARGFGEMGYTVYVTGRTTTPGDAKGWDGSVLPGTVAETAAAVAERGGEGIPVICDHGNDAQVARLFEQIAAEQGRLDILVNNAAYMHHQLIEKKPFWEKELDGQKILDVGLRSAYVASWLKVLSDDKRAIFQAAAHAQRAATYLHSGQPQSETQQEAA